MTAKVSLVAVLRYECDGNRRQLLLCETSDGCRLTGSVLDELFTGRRDAARDWMYRLGVLKQDGGQIHEYSLYGWMTAAGTAGWEFAAASEPDDKANR